MNNRFKHVRNAGLCFLFATIATADVALQPIPAGQWTGVVSVSLVPEPQPVSVCVTAAQSADPRLLIPPPPAGCNVQPTVISATSFSWTTRCGQTTVNTGAMVWSSTSLQRSVAYMRGQVTAATTESLKFASPDCASTQVLEDAAPPAAAQPLPARAPALIPEATLIGAGDIALCEKIVNHTYPAWHTGLLIKQMLGQLPAGATVFTAGDNAYMWGTEVDFNGCYDPAWGAFRNITFPTAGNHDLYTRNGDPYYDYFGANAGPRGRGYYSYDRGTWHIVALNSNAVTQPQLGAQLQWLKSDLDANQKPCLAAYWHHPLYSSGNHGSDPGDAGRKTTVFWAELLNHHADVVIAGHDHIYERFALQNANGQVDPKGIREFVVGTGGGDLDTIPGQKRPNSEKLITSRYGVLVLTLHAGSYEWQFVCALCPGEGPVLDASAQDQKCHGAP